MRREEIEAEQASRMCSMRASPWYAVESRGTQPPIKALLYAVSGFEYVDPRTGDSGQHIHGKPRGELYRMVARGEAGDIEAVAAIDDGGQPWTVWLGAVLGLWTADHQSQVDADRAQRVDKTLERIERGRASLAALDAAHPDRNPRQPGG